MTIELYAAPAADFSEAINSPISNTTGELPDQEPTLDLGALLGSFDSQEEALAFIQDQFTDQQQRLTDSRIIPFDDHIHISGLTVTIENADHSTERRNYYLVTDEGY